MFASALSLFKLMTYLCVFQTLGSLIDTRSVLNL